MPRKAPFRSAAALSMVLSVKSIAADTLTKSPRITFETPSMLNGAVRPNLNASTTYGAGQAELLERPLQGLQVLPKVGPAYPTALGWRRR